MESGGVGNQRKQLDRTGEAKGFAIGPARQVPAVAGPSAQDGRGIAPITVAAKQQATNGLRWKIGRRRREAAAGRDTRPEFEIVPGPRVRLE